MKIIVISTNAGTHMGGEAIKAYQYFSFLLGQGHDAYLVTHARCRAGLKAAFPADRVLYVEDGPMQKLFWRSRVFRGLVSDCFHLLAARLVKNFKPEDCILHYLCPISPLIRRHPPKGYRFVIGPLSGNIFYPPAFSQRMSRKERLKQRFYEPLQRLNSVFFRDKKSAHRLLNSGYERTRKALEWAGAERPRMLDVTDSGIEKSLADHAIQPHEGVNTHFVFLGRLVGYKGADLAIRAVADAGPEVELTLYGNGDPQPELERLVSDLSLENRVHFAGWLAHDELTEISARFRGFVFPTLAEANGIVMQEAMMLGWPVITLNWGGPTELATAQEAIFVDPTSEASVISDMAAAMSDLARNPDRANQLAQAARRRAERDYGWETVATSWQKAYDGL